MSAPRGNTLGMVLKGYPRISETFISNEIRLLEEQGYKIHIFSMRKPRENFSHASVKRIKAKVTYLPESMIRGLPALLASNFRLFCRMPGRYLKGVKFMLSRFRGAPKKHTWLKHFLQGGFMVEQEIQKGEIGHIHAHFAHTPTSVAMNAAVLSGLPFSFTAHAKDIYTQDEKRTREKMKRAEFVVTCTGYNKNHLEKLGGDTARIHTVYHGIDLTLFSMNGKSPAARPPYAIMTVARFVEKKGLDTIFEALRILKDRGIDFMYTLVGDGKDRKKVLARIRDLGLDQQVTLTGTITHEEVLRIYETADLFVLGCREAHDGDRDGIPNVVAESMAMGVPVAATTVSGIPELVEQEKTGLLCPSNDPGALAGIMQRLLTDANLRAEVIPAARAKVEKVFDNTALIRDLAGIYERESGVNPEQRN